MSTDSFFKELNKKKYTIDYDKKTVTYCIDDNNCDTKTYAKHFNTPESIIHAKNKILTSKTLSDANIPIPKYLNINLSNNTKTIKELIKYNNITYPVVIKPINGTFGRDVLTDIESIEELDDSLQFMRNKYKNVMLEEQIAGDCYRIFIFNNNVIDIIKREKPYVIGNGVNTIKELIDMRNIEQIDMKLFEVKNISEIVIKKQNETLVSIPDDGKKIFISNVINMHNGARISRIPIDTVPQKNIDLFLNVNKAMNITCSGLDYLSEDICIEYDLNNSRILEVNGTPDTEIHGKIKNYNFFEKIVNSIFN